MAINDHPEYVAHDADNFQSNTNELEADSFVKAVNEGIEDMRSGRGMSVDQAFASIRDDLGL